MKRKYPRYEQGELNKIGKKISAKDKEVLDLFLKKSSITASPKRVEKIKKILFQVIDVTQKSILDLNKETINEFLSLLNNSDKSNSTKDEIKIYLKQFILWHYADLSLVENIKAGSRKGLNPKKITENNLLTEKDLTKMLRFAQSFKDKAYLLLVFWSGARPQEILNLKWKDIKFEDKVADVILYSGKTGQGRTFPVVGETMKALWEWKQHYPFPDVKSDDFIFVSRWRGQSMTTAGLNKMLRRMSKLAGIEKDVWNYLIRHTRATRLYEELPQQIVEKLMGHKNMAGVYAHISSKKAREEMLNKIYNLEDLSTEEKKEIEELKEDMVKEQLERKKLQKKFDEIQARIDQSIKFREEFFEIIGKGSLDPSEVAENLAKKHVKALAQKIR